MSDVRLRLLLIEDDPQLGPLIETVLAEAYDVTLVADGDAGLAAGLEGLFDVFVIDRRLPGRDGVDVVEMLRRNGVVAPILMLTALGAVTDRVAGLDSGANDYLVKPFDFDELLARLRALLRTFTGEGRLIHIGPWEFYPQSRCVYSPYEGRIQLTPREATLLELLADNPGRTFSRNHILRTVFDDDDQPGTVDTYVHYVRRKTETHMIATVRGAGYRLGDM
jgi:DNA-binding response OmpR family regulator